LLAGSIVHWPLTSCPETIACSSSTPRYTRLEMQATASDAGIWRWALEIVTFAAHFVSLTLGLIALWALIFRRKKLALIFRVFMSVFLNEKLRRIRETLNKLETLNYDEKQNRAEIRALFGQVSGQIKPMIGSNDGLAGIHKSMCDIVENAAPLTEAKKRSAVAELHGVLDNIVFTTTSKFLD
jgi:hypothetical protein